MADCDVTPEYLRSILRYEPETGRLYWKHESRGGFKNSVLIHLEGDEAGCTRKDGRRVVRVCGRLFMSYRVAWAIYYGVWPDLEIDHINGDRTDDRLENLRSVSRQVNQQNLRFTQVGKSSSCLLGVYLDKRKSVKKWRSSITVNGRQISLGYFLTEKEAHEAYLSAKRKAHKGCTI